MKKQSLTIGMAFLIPVIILLMLLYTLVQPGISNNATLTALVHDTEQNSLNSSQTANTMEAINTETVIHLPVILNRWLLGVSYYLDSFNDPSDYRNNFIASRGDWCESAASNPVNCTGYNLLHTRFITVPHHGENNYALTLDYNVAQTGALASYYEHLFDGDWLSGKFHDLSVFDEFRFWVKGEGSTVSSNTKFYIRFTDMNWHMVYVPIYSVSNEWEEKVIDLTTMSAIDWQHMRELTIIFENNQANSARIVSPLSGTLYFDDLVFIDNDDRDTTEDEFLDLLERRAFQYFWSYAYPPTGLIRERASEPEVASIASIGFGLSAICAAQERGWISHAAAYDRVLATLDSFYDDPNDPNDLVISGTHGLFYHFVDIHTGEPKWTDVDGVSTIDSALLMAGVLTVKQCFTETEIVTRATAIYEAADWDWFLNEEGLIRMCWTPEKGFVCPRETGNNEWAWGGYNEAMILYLLAIGSSTHPIPPASWDKWAATYQWGEYDGYWILLHGPSPLFAHQYSHIWIDFRDKKDAYASYFRNSRYATLANRAYSRDIWYADPEVDLWGFSASDGPITDTCTGVAYKDYGYPPDPGYNNGTIAPTAAGGSIVFTPPESISTLQYMYRNYHNRLWGLFGLKDSLNVWCEPDWFDNDYVGISVGATLLMIENYRSNLIWNTFGQNQEITEAMDLVGFEPDLPLVDK